MRKKAERKVVVTIPDGDENDDDKTATEKEVDDAVGRAEEEVPSKVESRIFRSHPATGNREAYTDTVDSDAVTSDYLRQQYGGGKYRVQVVGPMPKGKAGKPGRGVLRILRFDVDASIPPKHPAQFAVQAPAQPNASPSSATSIDVALATMIMGMVKQMGEGTTALQTMQMQMMQDHSKMLAAQLANLAPKAERDPLDVLEAAAKIIRPNETKTTGFAEFIQQYQSFKEIIGDSGDKETSWLDVIKEVAPSLIDAAKTKDRNVASTKGGASGGVGERPRALPSGEPQSDGTSSSPQRDTEQPNVNPNLRFITPIMPRVLKWATQGKDVTLCAEWLLSDIPAGFFPMLREQLSSPTFVEDVVAAFPAADPFRLWIGQLRDVLVENTAPETDDEPDAEGGDDTPE